jgi:hypothetical protein
MIDPIYKQMFENLMEKNPELYGNFKPSLLNPNAKPFSIPNLVTTGDPLGIPQTELPSSDIEATAVGGFIDPDFTSFKANFDAMNAINKPLNTRRSAVDDLAYIKEGLQPRVIGNTFALDLTPDIPDKIQTDDGGDDKNRKFDIEDYMKFARTARMLMQGTSPERDAFMLGEALASEKGTKNRGIRIGTGIAKNIFNVGSGVAAGFANRRSYDRTYQDFLERSTPQNNTRYTASGKYGGDKKSYEMGGAMTPEGSIEAFMSILRKKGKFIPKGKLGGLYGEKELTELQAATGEFVTGLPKFAEHLGTLELEGDEYIRTPEDGVQKIIGKSHAEGGEMFAPKSEIQALSDSIKLSPEARRVLNKGMGLKVGTSKTYADAMDVFTKEIGLDELTKDQEKVLNYLKKQEDVKSEATAEVNTEFLAGKIDELETRRKVLEGRRDDLFQALFEDQERLKLTSPKLQKQMKVAARKDIEEFEKELENFNNYNESIL